MSERMLEDMSERIFKKIKKISETDIKRYIKKEYQKIF